MHKVGIYFLNAILGRKSIFIYGPDSRTSIFSIQPPLRMSIEIALSINEELALTCDEEGSNFACYPHTLL